MADENKDLKKGPEPEVQEFGDDLEEFQLDDDEPNHSNTKKMVPPILPPTRRNPPKIQLIIGGVITVFLLYKGISWFLGGSHDKKKAAILESQLPISHEDESNMGGAPLPMETADVASATPIPSSTGLPATPQPTDTKKAEQNDALSFLSEVQKLSSNEKAAPSAFDNTPAPASAAPAVTTTAPSSVPVSTATPPVSAKTNTVAPVTTQTNASIPATTAAVSTATVPTSAPATSMPSSVPEASVPPAAPAAADTAADAAALNQLQQQWSTQNEESDKRLEAMDRAIYRLTKRMEQMQDSVGQLGHDMGGVNQSMTVLATELKKIGQSPDNQMKSEIAKTDDFINPNYTVHAIIPGRAWLREKSGRILTVTEGDSLDQYGKILVIDAPNGVVITSSGITLR